LQGIWTKVVIGCVLAAVLSLPTMIAVRVGAAWMARRRRLQKLELRGYQAGNVTAFRSSTIVVTIKRRDHRYKLLQVGFLKDGSVFVTFPYFKHRTGLLSVTTTPATGRPEAVVNLEHGGKVTSHLIKYSHHPTGLALFSQTGKVRSEVRRQSVRLDEQEGHLFTVMINGIEAFRPARGAKDSASGPDRTAITFELPANADPSGTLKIVGRWYDVSRLRFAGPVVSAGPKVQTVDPDGQIRSAAALANPAEGTRHVLLLTCEVMPRVGTDPEMLMFIGGFDPREVMDDTRREAGFLAFVYPAANPGELKQKLGTVDFASLDA
jgi:hypothetical protein